MDPVWDAVELYIGTSATSATPPVWTYAKLCKGIESVTPNFNENNVQSQFLCGEGFAHNEVTGAAPEIQVSGRRIIGDDAQDYIAGLQWTIGSERNSSVKLVTGGKQMICDCSVGDIVSFGGSATDLNQFSCTIRLNGHPTVTDVA